MHFSKFQLIIHFLDIENTYIIFLFSFFLCFFLIFFGGGGGGGIGGGASGSQVTFMSSF